MVMLAVVVVAVVAATLTGLVTAHSGLGGPLAPRVTASKIADEIERHLSFSTHWNSRSLPQLQPVWL